MSKVESLSVFVFWLVCELAFPCFSFGQNPTCGFEWIYEKQRDFDTSFLKRYYDINEMLEEAVYSDRTVVFTRSEIVIPVVVHIVWNALEENVSDQAILSQIEILNRDFNGRNSDIIDTPSEFQPFIAIEGIQFCLAAEDPFGLPTSGIVRVKTDIQAIGATEKLFFSSLGGSDAWDTDRYVNIWVANTGEFVTGYASFPESVIPEKDRVVIHPKYFGENNSPSYGLGRVAVHELGHYLGLNHIWGDGSGCHIDDGIVDTPLQEHFYGGCPTYPQNSCGSNDMFMNFMDYVNDDCMVMFTQGQMERMIATINVFRSGLLAYDIPCVQTSQCKSDDEFVVFPNPSKGEIVINFQTSFVKTGVLKIYDIAGRLIFNYNGVLQNEMKIVLECIGPGVYWIQIGKKIKKFVLI